MEIGEVQSAKLPFWKNGIQFSCGENGLLVDGKHGNISLNATDKWGRKIYCAIPLGLKKDLKGMEYTVKAQSKTRMLCTVGKVRFIFDFAAKKSATNLLGMTIYGSEYWGESVQMPWRAEYLPLFGLPMPPAVLDAVAAELFWKWFLTNETAIIDMAKKGKRERKHIHNQTALWLEPVFPYERNGDIDFKLDCGDRVHTFSFYHGGHEQLQKDGAVFGEMMPEVLRQQWKFVVEE